MMARLRTLTSSLSPPLRLLAILLLATTAVVAFVGLRDDARAESDADTRPALPVLLVQIEQETHYAVRERHAGRVVSRRSSDLGFERSGRLVEVGYDQGERVEAGAVLARLDTRELRARRREHAAERERIVAELTLARSTADRREELHATGVVSTQRFDESVYAQQSLESQMVAATAAIERLDVQLELSELRAPFAGILAYRYADEGTVLGAGAPVLKLIEADALEVHVGLPPSAASRLEIGSRHPVEIEGTVVEAVLDTLLPTIDPDTRTLTGVFQIDSPPDHVRHGALARIAVETEVMSSGFWVPIAALTEGRRGLWTAYVAAPTEAGLVAERRQVEVIHAEADRAFVRGTLYDQERLVASGLHRIVPDMPVRASREG